MERNKGINKMAKNNLENWMERIGYYDQPGASSSKVRALFYGPTGCGKTTLAATFPNPFFIDTDKGGKVLNDQHIPFISLERGEKIYKPIIGILNKIKNNEKPFDEIKVETLVIDSLTALADLILVESMKYPQTSNMRVKDHLTEKPEYDHWNLLLQRLKEIIKRSQDININIVATAGQKLEQDQVTGGYIGEPNILGSYRTIIGHDFDEFYYLTTKGSGSKIKYMTYTKKHQYFDAKTRTKGIPIEMETASYEKLFKG